MLAQSAREFGLVVRGRRQELGWSQEELAERAGVTRWWVSRFESGKAGAQLDMLLRTLDALGLEVDVRLPVQTPTSEPEHAPTIDLDELLRLHAEEEAVA